MATKPSSGEKKQLGARVKKQTSDDFKSLVRYKNKSTKGPLGEAHEEAMKLYIASYFVQNPAELSELANSDDIDDPDIEDRTLQYLDDVGGELVRTSISMEAAAGGSDPTPLSKLKGTPVHIWHRVRSALFNQIDLSQDNLESLLENLGGFKSIGELEEALKELEKHKQNR